MQNVNGILNDADFSYATRMGCKTKKDFEMYFNVIESIESL